MLVLCGIIYVFVLVAMFAIAFLLNTFINMIDSSLLASVEKWQIILGVIVVSIPVTFIVLKIIEKRESQRPIAVIRKQMVEEMNNNGITDRIFELVDKGMALYDGGTSDFSYYKDFVIIGAEVYMISGNIDKALQLITKIDKNEIINIVGDTFDKGQGIVTYFTVQMELCADMHDLNRANMIFSDSKPYMEKYYGKLPAVDMTIDGFYSIYYLLCNDGNRAREYAEKVLNNKFHVKNNHISGHMYLAMAYHKLGNVAKVSELLAEAERRMEVSKRGWSKDVYAYYKKQMGDIFHP